MLRTRLQSARPGLSAPRRAGSARHVHSPPPSAAAPPPEVAVHPPRPPPPKYIRFATVYPFILLSIITSLALNLSVQRTARETEGARHRAQITVLEEIVARLRTRNAAHTLGASLSEAEQDEIERELELVGLGRGKGKEAVSAEMSVKTDEATSWSEVFLGKKGRGYEQEEDKTDWEAVFRQAEEAERTKQTPSVATVPAPVPATLPPPPAPTAPTSSPTPRPNPSKPIFL
ncbi:hypothetical protein JCM10908_001644 [Rhodotorula pacifica]|uniref:uncharacterized protein n=1 Tax=Rhodotorula pacifica TaxID=1495444 RepID=UPI00316E1693